jgi:hypothetical protein
MFRSLGANIWDHETRIRFGGIPLWHRMTVIRLTGGDLVVHSPTRLDLASQEEFQKLGHCCDCGTKLVARSISARVYKRINAYPNARLYVAPTLAKWNRSLPFVEVLGESEPSPWEGEIDQFHVQGIGLFPDEVCSIIRIVGR